MLKMASSAQEEAWFRWVKEGEHLDNWKREFRSV